MKKILVGVISLILIVAAISCSEDKDPQIRVHNERSTKANVQIQTFGGNTININDVEAGQTTSYKTVYEGNVVATAVIQNESVSPTVTSFVSKGESYTIVIQAGNTPVLRVDRE